MVPLLFYQVINSGSINLSKCKCCKVMKTRASRLNYLALTVGLKLFFLVFTFRFIGFDGFFACLVFLNW